MNWPGWPGRGCGFMIRQSRPHFGIFRPPRPKFGFSRLWGPRQCTRDRHDRRKFNGNRRDRKKLKAISEKRLKKMTGSRFAIYVSTDSTKKWRFVRFETDSVYFDRLDPSSLCFDCLTKEKRLSSTEEKHFAQVWPRKNISTKFDRVPSRVFFDRELCDREFKKKPFDCIRPRKDISVTDKVKKLVADLDPGSNPARNHHHNHRAEVLEAGLMIRQKRSSDLRFQFFESNDVRFRLFESTNVRFWLAVSNYVRFGLCSTLPDLFWHCSDLPNIFRFYSSLFDFNGNRSTLFEFLRLYGRLWFDFTSKWSTLFERAFIRLSLFSLSTRVTVAICSCLQFVS